MSYNLNLHIMLTVGDYGGQGEAFDKYGDEDINWFIGGAMYRLNVLQPYFGQFLSDVTSDILTW